MKRSTALLRLLSVSGLCYLTLSISPPQYQYISLQINYSQAQTYCRDMYTDLATIYNSGDLDRLVQLVPNGTASVWIGLEFGDEFEWHWSLPDQRKMEFFNWRAAEPKQNNTQDSCAAMDPNGQWFEDNCQIKRGFVCFDGKNASNSHIFIDDSKTWREAQDHCRGTYTDLASIRSREENHHVQNMSLSQSMWIGLFKDPWKWSDGSNSSYRFWKNNQTNNFRGDQNCTSVILNDNKWNVQWCNISWGFVCHGEMKRPTTQIPPTTPPTATVPQTTPPTATVPQTTPPTATVPQTTPPTATV
ncbi:macrophage mannose receptor 1-like, partial [Oncorhynchus keta]|uniref:macrophage mannose receptor 1-like n=1 Tax=Oncorhynchus keta TaxID=8018 RepID=UPI00227D4B4B